jgi:hypothetical protein
MEDLGVDGRIILEWILGKGWEVVNWINLAQDHWQAFVNTIISL